MTKKQTADLVVEPVGDDPSARDEAATREVVAPSAAAGREAPVAPGAEVVSHARVASADTGRDAPARRMSLPMGMLMAVRPRQWMKNVLVAAAPLAAGRTLNHSWEHVVVKTALAFVVFVMISGAVYLLNDTYDREADRRHPAKRYRPIAAGVVPVPLAMGYAAVLTAAAITLSAVFGTVSLAIAVAAYGALMVGYCLGWKHEPVLDLAVITLGFLLRAIAGGLASDIPLSSWFLIVAAFGSLFMAAGKRYSEILRVGDGNSSTRKVLASYSASYLRTVWTISAAVSIMAYCLWAFQIHSLQHSGPPWSTLSVIPFVVAILRYARDIDSGAAEAPEEVVLGDRQLLFLGGAWCVLFGLGAFGVGG